MTNERTLTMHVGRVAAFRTAIYILWMLVRHPRSSVEFEVKGP